MTKRKHEQLGDTSQETTARELIILAMGPTRTQCPFDAETWGVNNGYKQVRELGGHLDKLFLAHCQTQDAEGNDLFDWDEINSLGIDVINTHRVKGLKSRLFPMKRIKEKFGSDYFSDTICYMLAYAIDQATSVNPLKLRYPFRIRLYGADMHTTDEYATEKGGIEHWLGFARGLGIKIDISDGSTLLRTTTGKPYGQRIKKGSLDITTNTIISEFVATATGICTGVIPDEVLDNLWIKIDNKVKV